MDEQILKYLDEHGPSFMEDIWVAVGEPWPWPQPLLKMRDAGELKYDTITAEWSKANV